MASIQSSKVPTTRTTRPVTHGVTKLQRTSDKRAFSKGCQIERMAVLLHAAATADSLMERTKSTDSCEDVTGPIDASSSLVTLSWAGAGIYFFWQLGAVKYLAKQYDLTQIPMVGASGGALAAVLASCGVSADLAVQRAHELSLQNRIWDKPFGLLGVWGGYIEKWLDDLLPDNAHELCYGRVGVIVTELPSCKQTAITDFTSKQDLINACMASSHIPFFLDMKFSRACRGKECVDGSFPDFFAHDNSDLLKCGGEAMVFDYFDDKALVRNGRMDMLELKKYEDIERLMTRGYQYAKVLHRKGRFASYDAHMLSVRDRTTAQQ